MDRALGHRITALLVGSAIAGGLGWLTGLLVLALVGGACWGIGTGVLLGVRRRFPRVGVGDGWTDVRWTGLAVAVVTLAALLGVPPALPLPPADRFGLSVLVLGAGLVAYASATMAELERRTEDIPDEVPTPRSRRER